MRIGLMMFPTDLGIQPIELAREAKPRGFDSLWFGSGICLVAQHDHVWLAKQVASIDVISGGRFTFGVGYGWTRSCGRRSWPARRSGPGGSGVHGEFVNVEMVNEALDAMIAGEVARAVIEINVWGSNPLGQTIARSATPRRRNSYVPAATS